MIEKDYGAQNWIKVMEACVAPMLAYCSVSMNVDMLVKPNQKGTAALQ